MANSDDEPVRVNILFDPRVAESITNDLTEAGLEVEQELELLAIITGRTDAKTVQALSTIDGVLAVEQERIVEAIVEPDEPQDAAATNEAEAGESGDPLFPDSPI